MSNISLRGIDQKIHNQLKKEARKRGISLNALLLEYIYQGAGYTDKKHKINVYHDLDHLAGTWSEEEVREFQSTSKDFEQIDQELWK